MLGSEVASIDYRDETAPLPAAASYNAASIADNNNTDNDAKNDASGPPGPLSASDRQGILLLIMLCTHPSSQSSTRAPHSPSHPCPGPSHVPGPSPPRLPSQALTPCGRRYPSCDRRADLVQGIPMGLVFGTIPFLLKGAANVSYTELGLFSLAGYPYSLKLLWSPIVDSFYWTGAHPITPARSSSPLP